MRANVSGGMSYSTNFIKDSFARIHWAKVNGHEHWYKCYRKSLQRALIEREIAKGNIKLI
jgi:hypothetical protein